jgi:guanosine-3',5'-bis(diphosphate) 3'-pyrophosphohydrolase
VQDFLKNLKHINSIETAILSLAQSIDINPIIQKALDFCIVAHKHQHRKSGEAYVIHPILVASITANFSKDESMVLAALLHDVVEDTDYDIEYIEENFGLDVAHIVDGLTKITEIKEKELSNIDDKLIKSALTFKKMIIASTDDVRVLVVKLFDRTHNMLTLDALDIKKQKRISEETLVVYAPIAHRLGMSAVKNILEDLSFYYLFPEEYNKIDNYITNHQVKIQKTFDTFVENINTLLDPNNHKNIQITSRIKHYYSIYLKTQRKGINIDEVLDLFAIRIITNTPLDCYKTLGKIHTNYRPLIARFKDYIAVPKENAYQTIHTTVFHNAKIFEIQIRTQNMHKVAEFGVAAHWNYKTGQVAHKKPKLDWLHTMKTNHDDVEEFYDDTKQDLFSEEVIAYSPEGDIFTLPKGSTAYDFAYLVHTDVGNKAYECLINNIRKPLLTQIKSGDIINIKLSDKIIPRCSWYDMVKTTKAQKSIKLICHHRIKEIDSLNGLNILKTIFSKYKYDIASKISNEHLNNISTNLDHFKNIKKKIENAIKLEDGFLARLKFFSTNLKQYNFDNIIIYSNTGISNVSLDHCCHPKQGDDIVAFRNKRDITIHHKMCDTSFNLMKENKEMVFCQWSEDKYFGYKMVLSIQHIKGELARLLSHLSKNEAIIQSIDFRRDESTHIQYCTLDLEIKNSNIDNVKKIVSKKAKIIEFYSSSDAYK